MEKIEKIKDTNKQAALLGEKIKSTIDSTQKALFDETELGKIIGLLENFLGKENFLKIKKNSRLIGEKSKKNNYLGNVIRGKFEKNINELKDFFENKEKYKGRKFYEFLIKEITEAGKKAKIAVEKIYEDVLNDFLSDSMNKKFEKFMKNFKDTDFLKNDLYNFDKLSDEELVLKSFFVMAVTYQLSYIFWMKKVYEQYKDLVKSDKDFPQKQSSINDYLDKLGISTQSLKYEVMFAQAYLLMQAFTQEEIKFLVKHIKKGRFKTLDSAVFKLLKKEKYVESYEKEDILADQYGFLLQFDNIEDLRKAASILRKKYQVFVNNKEKKLNVVYVNKYNDRGVLDYTADNSETGEKLLPFVNGGFILGNVPLGEISCRFDYKVRLNEILQEYTRTRNKPKLVDRLLNEIDEFDHEIYKTSQIIKILRKLFVDKKILPAKRNLKKSAEQFIDKKLEYLIKDIRKKFKENGIDIDFTDEELKVPILERLAKQTRQAIIDLAWEKTKHYIKTLNSYKKLSSQEKREYLKEISKKLLVALNKKQKQIKGFGSEGNKILRRFRKNYKEALETSIFYPNLVSKVDYVKELEKAKFNG